MQTKKVVGAIAAAMLSLSVCSPALTSAADETVQISVGTATALPGETFSVDVSFADIPSTGIQGCEFNIEFDNSLITIDSVTAGALTETGAENADLSVSELPVFDNTIINEEGILHLGWSTLADSSYWLNGEGVFCTINGTVASDAKNGTTAELKVTPIRRETYPGSGIKNELVKAGYVGSDGLPVNYAVKTADGAVKIGSSSATLLGDANDNGEIEVADAVFILQGLADPSNEEFKRTPQGEINADCHNIGNGVDSEDALAILKFKATLITSF